MLGSSAPLAEASLLPLDEKRALPRNNKERLLAGLGVVEAVLARFQDGDVDAELRELDPTTEAGA